MVATARRLNPTLPFHQGDFFNLSLADGELAGVAAFYCLIHCARGELRRAVAEIHRVLMPGGRFLMAVHAGEGEVGRDEAYGKRVALVATLFSDDEVRGSRARRRRVDSPARIFGGIRLARHELVRELPAGRENLAAFVRVVASPETTSSPSSRARSMRLAALGLPTADGGRAKASAPPRLGFGARHTGRGEGKAAQSTPHARVNDPARQDRNHLQPEPRG